MIDNDVEISANKQADLAYNEVIIRSVVSDMYEQYGIDMCLIKSQVSCGRIKESKSESELNAELVNVIAIEKAKGKLRGEQ